MEIVLLSRSAGSRRNGALRNELELITRRDSNDLDRDDWRGFASCSERDDEPAARLDDRVREVIVLAG